MIVKIWPIKADYASDPQKVGGVEGLKNALEYICDESKVIVKHEDLGDMDVMKSKTSEEQINELDGSTSRVINYMSNAEKIEGKYISGYLCNPENAVELFDWARDSVLAKANREQEKENGAVAYHIVQSFSEGVDISDEEVHQCGIELCQKLGVHQAVITSHVHPEVDEKGQEVSGKCKHNHILINAYIHPDKWDPKHPERIKYNDCKETYAQLRQWNDEIAIEHGLPIIRSPDKHRTYSWFETKEANRGLSWKERMRLDIDAAKKLASNWEEFVAIMEKSGYKIRDGKHPSFTSPDGEHTARGKTLGKQYTKEALELFWSIRNNSKNAVDQAMDENTPPPLFDFVHESPGDYFAVIPIGEESEDRQGSYPLPFDKIVTDRETMETYFDPNGTYSITDTSNTVVTTVSGEEILNTFDWLHHKEKFMGEKEFEGESEYEATRGKKRYYTCYVFVNSKTKRPYRTSLYDANGRRRSTLELLFLLAIIVLKKEDGLWNDNPVEAKDVTVDNILRAPTSWKIQNMYDAIETSRTEGIETIAELNRRLNAVGADLSRAKSGLKKVTRAKEKMETLYRAVQEYNKTKDLAQRLLDLPDGPEKEDLQRQHKEVIQRYKEAKAVMYRFSVTEDHQVEDFLNRYSKIQEDIKELRSRKEAHSESYTMLRKLHYQAQLAANAQYCYGPNYTYDRVYDQIELQQRMAQTESEKQRLDDQIEQSRQAESSGVQHDKEQDMKK